MLRVLSGPTDLPGCLLWLDAADIATITKDGSNLVSQWSDKSGNANHATEATPANQPTYTATGFGGFPGVDWGDGSVVARRLATPSISYDRFTVFLVLRSGAGGTYVYVHETASSSNRDYFIASSTGNPTSDIRRAAGGQSGKNVTPLSSSAASFLQDSTRHIVTRIYSGTHASHRVRQDGCDQQAVTYTTLNADPIAATSTGPIYVGNADTAVAPIRGVIAEFVVFGRALSDGEIVLVEQYLARKWAIAQMGRLIASPLELPDCARWLDATVGVTLDGSSKVSQWNDQSGNANHAAQGGDATRRPAVATVGTATVIRFDGSNDLLQLTNNITASAQSIFAVARLRSAPTNAYRVLVLTQKVSFYASTQDGFGNLGVYLSGIVSSGEQLGTGLAVLSAVVDAGRVTAIRSNLATKRRNVVGASFTGQSATEIGATAGTQAADLDLAELIIFSRSLTDGEVVAVEAYLKRKYAL